LKERHAMRIGVLLLNFGEPEEPTMETVVPFLERIFSLNAPLMQETLPSPEEVRARSRALAEARAPGLIAEYEEIGGSPLHRQAREQAEALGAELGRRGHDARVLLGMQFTDPSIAEAVSEARRSGVDFLVSIPVYPLCGPSTSVAALREVDRQVEVQGWEVASRQVTGWHRHPAYAELRAAAVRQVLYEHGLDLRNARIRLVFSAHGTPVRYLEQGSRYDEYVREHCARVAAMLGASDYDIGYQNHTNRPGVEWTQPDIDRVIEEVDADTVVIDAISFMHEQSETLAELDDELRSEAEERGLRFFRVPIPHVASEFVGLLADLVEEAVRWGTPTGDASVDLRVALHPCRCKPSAGTVCTNGPG
jgi:protoporphyrin/coproporphyrin ferrochelatase